MSLSSLIYLEMAHCLHEGKQHCSCCIKVVNNGCNKLAVITRKIWYKLMILKFDLDKFDFVLVQNKIFLSLAYFAKFLMIVLQ